MNTQQEEKPRQTCPQGCGSEVWHVDVDCPSPKKEKCIAFCNDCNAEFTEWLSDSKKCPECEGKMYFKDCLLSTSWEETELEIWKKEIEKYQLFTNANHSDSMPYGRQEEHTTKYWLNRLKAAREESYNDGLRHAFKSGTKNVYDEGYHAGCHETDTKVTEQFNRALKDESSELVRIIKHSGRLAALQEVREMLKILQSGELCDSRSCSVTYVINTALSNLQNLIDTK